MEVSAVSIAIFDYTKTVHAYLIRDTSSHAKWGHFLVFREMELFCANVIHYTLYYRTYIFDVNNGTTTQVS